MRSGREYICTWVLKAAAKHLALRERWQPEGLTERGERKTASRSIGCYGRLLICQMLKALASREETEQCRVRQISASVSRETGRSPFSNR